MLTVGSSRHSAPALQTTSRMASQEVALVKRSEKTSENLPTVSITSSMGSKLADALWSMESKGVALNQTPSRTALNKEEKIDAADEFLKVSKMTPAERIRYFFLKDRELNEEKLAAMSQQDQEKIEEQIKQLIFERLGLEDEDGKPGENTVAPAPEGPPVPIDAAEADGQKPVVTMTGSETDSQFESI
jgi:hypothetical protein